MRPARSKAPCFTETLSDECEPNQSGTRQPGTIFRCEAEYHPLPKLFSRITKHAGAVYRPVQELTGLAVEQTGLISRDIEVGIFLVHLFVAVDSVLLRIVPHNVVPPIEQRLGFGLVEGITIGVARILLNQPSRDVVDLAVSLEGVQHDKETGLMVIQLIDTSIEIGLGGKRIRTPSRPRRAPEQHYKNEKDESTQIHYPSRPLIALM